MARYPDADMEQIMKPPTLIRESPKASALTPADRELLAELESRVENSMMDFCRALAQIRDHKDGIFWKRDHSSFQEYVRGRYGYGEQHAGRLVATGGFLLQLENSESKAPKPIRENQVRPLLNKLPASHQIPCWEKITSNTPPAKLTGDIIAAEVVQYRKTIPAAELNATKPDRKPKKSFRPNEKKVREQCHTLLAKLKLVTTGLPKVTTIHGLLKSVAELIDVKI